MKWDYRLLRVRRILNLTQAEMGERLGVSKNYIWLLESAAKKPSKTLMLLFSYIEREVKFKLTR